MKKYITTHKELLKLDGASVTCEIEGKQIDDAKIRVENEYVYVCQNDYQGTACENKLGYNCSWIISKDYFMYEVANSFCTNIALKEPKVKTLEDLEVGDLVVCGGDYSRILGICGQVYHLSISSRDLTSDYLKCCSGDDLTLYELEGGGYKPYTPAEEPKKKEVTREQIAKKFKVAVEDLIIKE